MVRRLFVLVALLAVGPAHAECTGPTTNAALVEALDTASLAFARLDIPVFQEDAARAREILDCLGEPISRPTAASWHRMHGIALFLERNSPAARRSFAAARSIEPAYTFPSDVVPEGNPLLEDYTALDPDIGPFELVAAPKVGAVRLDGSGSLNRSRGRPVIYQVIDGRGAVVQTALLDGEDAMPALPENLSGGPSSNGDDKVPKERKGPSVPLLVGAGVGVLAAGGLYAGSAASRSAYFEETQVSELDGRRATTNALAVGSGVSAAVAVGLGTTSFLIAGRF